MRYLTQHRQAFYFQIRVPAVLRPQYGALIRVNLQTGERDVARPLALQLAAYWLTRFSAESLGERVSFAPPASIAPLMSAADSPVNSAAPLRMADAFAYWRGLVARRPERTVVEFGATADDVDERIGIDLARLQRQDVARYRDLLLADGLAPATVTKRLGFVSALLHAMYDAGRLPGNVARGLRVPRAKVAAAGRREFRADELRALYASPIYASGKRPRGCGGEAAAWLPVLGLVTGARLEELAQLRVEDVVADGDKLVLRIQDDGETRRLKTVSWRRLVPVHPCAIDAGFAQYVQRRRAAGDGWLFPDLKSDRFGRSGPWSKWFGNYLRSARGCAIADRRVVFHSLRHNFKSMCRAAGIPEEVHDALTGHRGGGVGRDYGSVPLKTLIDAVERIELPVALPAIAIA